MDALILQQSDLADTLKSTVGGSYPKNYTDDMIWHFPIFYADRGARVITRLSGTSESLKSVLFVWLQKKMAFLPTSALIYSFRTFLCNIVPPKEIP